MQPESITARGFRFVRSTGFYVVKRGTLSAPHRVTTLERLSSAHQPRRRGDADAKHA